MTTVKSKSIRKKIRTILTVKLMEGKTVRDMYRDFFQRGKTPKGFDEKIVRTLISLDKEFVSCDLYKKFSGHGASREFLEDFEFKYISEYETISQSDLVEAMYEVVSFMTESNISSYIVSYTVGSSYMETTGNLDIEIETSSWRKGVLSDDVKRINKENARKLRHYLVSLPSVQGVPYSCTFKEDESNELECSI